MKVSKTQTFEFDDIYDLGEIARIIGAKLGGKFIADATDEPLNGYLTQQNIVTPEGNQKSLVTVYFYDDDEEPIIPEAVLDTDPEDVKMTKRRQRELSHTNPFRKLVKTKTRELSIESEIKKIKSGKLNIRKLGETIAESKSNESKRRKDHFDKIKKPINKQEK